ncbi:predicted protein [Histoplasma capsulatum H143]|uniref:Uncharacterized protein n=1 Tax=Ajellomyces capsulatus (strain H143) TaxID=544712 RepID=C6HKV5_AJECH|nr:predicted protein [Histoplasma capsulatum H143]
MTSNITGQPEGLSACQILLMTEQPYKVASISHVSREHAFYVDGSKLRTFAPSDHRSFISSYEFDSSTECTLSALRFVHNMCEEGRKNTFARITTKIITVGWIKFLLCKAAGRGCFPSCAEEEEVGVAHGISRRELPIHKGRAMFTYLHHGSHHVQSPGSLRIFHTEDLAPHPDLKLISAVDMLINRKGLG